MRWRVGAGSAGVRTAGGVSTIVVWAESSTRSGIGPLLAAAFRSSAAFLSASWIRLILYAFYSTILQPYAFDSNAPSYFLACLPLSELCPAHTSKLGTVVRTGNFKQTSTSLSEYRALSVNASRYKMAKDKARPAPKLPPTKIFFFGNDGVEGRLGASNTLKVCPCCSCSRSEAIAEFSRFFRRSLYISEAV